MPIKYHFFGKECLINRDLTDYSDLEKNLAKQGFVSPHKTAFVNQIHSNEVLTITNYDSLPQINSRPKADAIVTNLSNLIIGVVTADCTPILMFEKNAKIIAATHAGWRGVFAGITDNVIFEMLKLGAKVENIQAIIGPVIRQKSYEISQEFYDDFLKNDLNNKKFFIQGARAGHYLFDLPSYVKNKLQNAGIKNISDDEIDTYSNPQTLFSYRRSSHLGEADCGRNISAIVNN